jgi:transposase
VGQVIVDAAVVAATADCPACGQPAEDVHSRYIRRIRDLPCCGRLLTIVVTARKFHCNNPACPRSIFCERLPRLARARARTTGPLTESHRAIGFAVGGEPGARLAKRLAMPTSPDMLLRRVKSAPEADDPPPRYVGVDDWAWKRGHRYGTIQIDLERRATQLNPQPQRKNGAATSPRKGTIMTTSVANLTPRGASISAATSGCNSATGSATSRGVNSGTLEFPRVPFDAARPEATILPSRGPARIASCGCDSL